MSNHPTAWLFFILFGVLLFIIYVAIRRKWASQLLLAFIGIVGSIILMTLTGLAQDNTIYQAIFAGILVGGLFSGGTLAIASYFQSAEDRRNGDVAGEQTPTY